MSSYWGEIVPLGALIWRELKLQSGTAVTLGRIVGPTIYLLFFALIFQNVLGEIKYRDAAINYIDFLLPGIVAMNSFLTYSMIFSLTSIDLRTNFIQILITSNTGISEYIVSRVIAHSLSLEILLIYLVALAWLLTGYLPSLLGLIYMAIFTFAGTSLFVMMGFMLGAYIRSDVKREIISVLLTPLIFASTIFYPLEALPPWLYPIARINPLTLITETIRLPYITASIPLIDAVGLLLYVVTIALLANRMLKYLIMK